MSLFAKLQEAMQNNNADKLLELYHEDFQFVRHQTNTFLNRDQILLMLQKMFASGIEQRDHRCLYENDDVLVEHSVMDFSDGSTEAVLVFHQIQDGKIIRTETGATLIQ